MLIEHISTLPAVDQLPLGIQQVAGRTVLVQSRPSCGDPIAERFALRAMDAIHFAATERVGEAQAPEAVSFVSLDRRQTDAAIRLGLRVPGILRDGTD